MMRSLRWTLSLALLLPALALAENWPAWRGPRLDGTSLETGIPTHWSSTSNVLWRTELPGYGHASPIVWNDRVFTVAVVSNDSSRVLLSLDARSGKLLWQQAVLASPLEKKHKLNSHASSTPATDGTLVYSAFLDGRQMLVSAHDFAGKLATSFTALVNGRDGKNSCSVRSFPHMRG